MSKIKLIFFIVILLVIAGLSTTVCFLSKKLESTKEIACVYEENIKAYESINDSLETETIKFKLTIEQLNYCSDSLVKELNKVRNDLKIKDSKLKSLEYIASHNYKMDTLFIRDTIFKEQTQIDTTINDEWSSIRLQLKYPDTIITDYSFRNETVVIAATEKVTADPPKKCWLGRLFQKKQDVIKVKVTQNNPYCVTDKIQSYEIIE